MTFPAVLGRFARENLALVVFAAGFLVFCASIAWWSVPFAGTCAGGILMLVAVYPYLDRPKA